MSLSSLLLAGFILADPRPQPAISAIVRAFETYPLVAIGENHQLRKMFLSGRSRNSS